MKWAEGCADDMLIPKGAVLKPEYQTRLSAVHRNMSSHGRALVITTAVYPGQPMGHLHSMIDLEMLGRTAGQERTEQEFATLLHSEGLTREEVTPMHGSFFAVVEATSA